MTLRTKRNHGELMLFGVSEIVMVVVGIAATALTGARLNRRNLFCPDSHKQNLLRLVAGVQPIFASPPISGAAQFLESLRLSVRLFLVEHSGLQPVLSRSGPCSGLTRLGFGKSAHNGVHARLAVNLQTIRSALVSGISRIRLRFFALRASLSHFKHPFRLCDKRAVVALARQWESLRLSTSFSFEPNGELSWLI